jgi:hypothetical protein
LEIDPSAVHRKLSSKRSDASQLGLSLSVAPWRAHVIGIDWSFLWLSASWSTGRNWLPMPTHRTGLMRWPHAEAGTDRLLGAHVVAPHAGDIIGEAALAVRFGLTTRDLVSTLHAYLTWGEALKLAAQTFTKDVAKLSCCA